MREVVVISKEGCHLCETVIEVLRSLSPRYTLEIKVLDISKNDKLHAEYWLRVPVVRLDGRDVFEARDMGKPDECRKMLEEVLTRRQ